MTIQMTQSAASIAAVSSNATLVNLSQTQAETFNLNASTIKASLKANETMAESDSKAILDAANASQAEAIGSFSGAIAGGVVTTGGLTAGLSMSKEAGDLEGPLKENDLRMSAVKQPETLVDISKVEGEVIATSKPTLTQEEGVPSNIKNDNNISNETTEATQKSAREQTSEEKAANRAKQAKYLRSKAQASLDNAGMYGKMVNDIAGSSGKLAGYNYQVDQAKQTKIKDTENGVSSTLNTLASLIGQQLGNLDQSRSAISQMIQGLYVRQG